MKAFLECIPCILNQIIKVLRKWRDRIVVKRLAAGLILLALFFSLPALPAGRRAARHGGAASADIKTTLEIPKCYVSCMPSLTEILYGLGLEEQIAGVTAFCDFPPEASKKEKVGGLIVNLEKIISLKPDLIFLLEDAQQRDIEKMKKFNLPLFIINPHSVEEVMGSILKLGEATRRREAAEQMVSVMRERINEVAKRIEGYPKKKIFLVIGVHPLTTVGRNNFINDIINLAGGINIGATSQSPYPQFSFEELIEQDPEALIILKGLIPIEQLRSDSRWKTLSAVRNNMVLFIEPNIVSRPTPRLVGAIEEIALFLHK